MTLSELLGTLQNTTNLVVTVKDHDETELVKFYAGGYEKILASVLAREVEKLTVQSATQIVAVLKGE